jgi:hypothetical protein
MSRTSEQTVTFRRPFVLPGLDGMQPAGDYAVEMDEELLDGISFTAYRRVRALIHLHAKPGDPRVTQVAAIDPNDLDAAVARDNAPAIRTLQAAADPRVPDREMGSRSEDSSATAIERGESEGMAVGQAIEGT